MKAFQILWKWFVVGTIILIFAFTATVHIVLRTYDFNKLKPVITRLAKEATGSELQIGGEIVLKNSLFPSIVATDTTVANAPWGSQPQMLKIEKLQVQVRLLPLLFKEVKIDQISLSGVDVLLETGPDGQGNWNIFQGTGPVHRDFKFIPSAIEVDRISIENLHFTYRNPKTGAGTQFTITNLAMNSRETGQVPTLDLRAEYYGQPLRLSGTTGRISQIWMHQHFPIMLSGSFAKADIDIHGAVADVMNLQGIELEMRLTGKNLSAFELNPDIKLPELRTLRVAGDLKGSGNDLKLENFIAELSGSSFDIAVSGSVEHLMAFRNLDLKLKSAGKDLAFIAPLIGKEIPATDEFKLEGHLTGSREAIAFRQAQGFARRGSMRLTVTGSVNDILTLAGMDLQSGLTGDDLAEFGTLIGHDLPATDQFDIQGRLLGSTEALALQKAQGNAMRGNMHLVLKGSVENLLTLNGMDLQSGLTGKDLAEFGAVIGHDLPATDEFDIQGRLLGSTETLALQQAQGNAMRGSVHLVLNGSVENLRTLDGMDLQSRLTGEDLAEFGAIIGHDLPATDQFDIQGRLLGSTKTLALQKAQGNAMRGNMHLVLNGSVENLLTLNGMDLQSGLTGKDLAEFGAIIGHALPATDQFDIQGRLLGSTKKLALQKAQGNAMRGSMHLLLNGSVEDLLTLNGMDLQCRWTGKALSEIGPLVGATLPDLGPFKVRGRMSGSAGSFSINKIEAIVDKSDFKGQVKVAFLKRPCISVCLESSVIDFTALMKSLEKNEQAPVDGKKLGRLLSNDDPLPFDFLKRMDADVVLKARNIHVKDARLEFGHLTLKLEEHLLNIDQLEAMYKGTKISGDLQVKAGSPSQVSTHFLIQDFDLGDFFKETGKDEQVRGIVDIAAYGESRGDSVKSLMAHLDGSFGAVMGEGYLTKYLDILSEGLTQQVTQIWRPSKKTIDQIECAVVQFDIKEGVATSQAFVFNTRAGLLEGEGEIDLGAGKINFLLVPEPRHPSIHLIPKLRVSGTVLKPKVSVDKLSALTRGATGLSYFAIGPLGLLAPFVHLGAHKAHPCDIKNIDQLGLRVPSGDEGSTSEPVHRIAD